MKPFPLLLALVGVGTVGYLYMKHAEAKKLSLPNGTIQANEVVLKNGTVMRLGGWDLIYKAKDDDFTGVAPEKIFDVNDAHAQGMPAELSKNFASTFDSKGKKWLLLIDDDDNFHAYSADPAKKTVFEVAL